MTAEHWIALGTFLLFVGTGMVTFGTVRSMQVISNSTDIIREATERLQTQTQKIESINTEIATKAGQISDLVTESLNQLTGAGSFCHVEATGNPDNSISLRLHHDGKYPLLDVSVEITDSVAAKQFWEKFKQSDQTQLGSGDINAARGVVFSQKIGTLNPHGALPLIGVLAANPNERRTFNILMTARNGFYMETINIIKKTEGNKWLVDERAFKITDPPTKEPIWVMSSPEFPRDQ
jgi:hypothetical protein